MGKNKFFLKYLCCFKKYKLLIFKSEHKKVYLLNKLALLMDKDTEDFYKRLKLELASSTNWPSEYLFKFIVPTDKEKISIIEDSFDDMGAVINTQLSKNGRYTSISVNTNMKSAQSVIDKYQELSTIEGIISL
jgi:putative lipoic acid-binding regulatory protein